jgi:presqualene diphosphate synthase
VTTPLGAAPADLAEIEGIVRAAGTSFYRGMRILPPDRRAAMYAIYAFCRLVDDIADEPAPMEQKRAALAQWRGRIAALGDGLASDAVTRVLLPAMQAFRLREADFLAVIDGMQADAETEIVAPSWAELDLYCDQVASAVGRLSVRAFGDDSQAADEVAYHLGRALQLTNILRDLAEDAQRGRLYLPREYLRDAGIPLSPVAALASPRLREVCDRVAAEAQAHFAAAGTAMDRCNRRAMRPARIMAATYRAVLAALQARGWAHPAQAVTVPAWRKLLIAARYAVA